jgi:hypothetical protein
MVTDKDIDGNTCLSLAVENGHYEVVKLCLEKSKFFYVIYIFLTITYKLFGDKSSLEILLM